jgi:large subunit ribosomal protein L13
LVGLYAREAIPYARAPSRELFLDAIHRDKHAMKAQLQTTFSPKPGDIERSWFVIDAAGVPLGRISSEIAQVLRGKGKPTYAPHVDGGDFVVVLNAEKVYVSGNKETEKVYFSHSGYPGGLRAEPLEQVRRDHPERLVEQAVRGMLPKNRLGRQMMRKLKVYAGPDHPHEAQDPQPMELKYRKAEA